MIRAGTRLPVELEGDIYSLCACNDAGARRLVAMMDEFALDGLDELAGFIFEASPPRDARRDREAAARHVPRRDRLGRLRGAGHAARGDDDPG